MYCRNSVSLHLIRGVCALMLVLALFYFSFLYLLSLLVWLVLYFYCVAVRHVGLAD